MSGIRYIQHRPLHLIGAALLLWAFTVLWLLPEMYRQYAYNTILNMSLVSRLFFVLLVVSGVGLVTGLVLFVLKQGVLSGMVVGIVIVVVVFTLLALVGSAIQQGLIPVSSARQNDRVYQLAYSERRSSDSGSVTYILYECDSAGIMCHVLYRDTERKLNFEDIDRSGSQPPLNPQLSVHPTTQTLTLEIGGEPVYAQSQDP